MFITITDASKGKPFILNEPIDNSSKQLMIGIRRISLWVGYYNIYDEQTIRYATKNQGESTEIKLEAGLYNFKQLVDFLTAEIENLSITVNRTNGFITMIVPNNIQIWLPEPVRYLLGLDDDGWLATGEYIGDRAVEFSPKRILIYLKQLSTTNNISNNNQKLGPSQLLDIIPITSESFGECTTYNFEIPHFKNLMTGNINELDFDFKVEWSNDVKHKLNNNSQPIDIILEIK